MNCLIKHPASQLVYISTIAVSRPRPRCAVVGLLLLTILISGCSLEAPKAPQWTVEVNVPLADRHYDLPYIITHADREELIWDSISGARFEVYRALDTIFVADNITFGNLNHTYHDSLGLIAIRPTETLSAGISLGELYSGPVGDVPEFSAQSLRDLRQLDEVQRAVITQGSARMQVVNNLGLPINQLQIDIEDIVQATQLGQVVFDDAIGPLAVAEDDFDLAGKTVSGRWRLVVYLQSPGGIINSVDDKSLGITIDFPDSLVVSEATATIPYASRLFIDTIGFSDSVQASAAVFQSGQLEIGITNGSPLELESTLHFPDLSTGGVPVMLGGTLAPNQTGQFILDLAGVSYSSQASGTTDLRIEIETQTPGTTSPVEISASQRLDVDVHVDSPVIESVTGILPRTMQMVSGLNAGIDLPDGFEDAGLAAAEIRMEVLSSLPFPGEFLFDLTGDRAQSLSITGELLPATGGLPIASAVNIADAASLLQPIPATISAAGTVYYGDGVTSGTARATDFVVPSFRLIAPLSVWLDGVSYQGETEGIKLTGEGDDLADRLGAASIFVEFENLLPFGAVVEVRLANHRADLPGNAEIVLGPTEIQPAIIDASGRTIHPQTSNDVFTISAEQAHIFEADSVFIAENIQLFTADSTAVTVQDTDYIHWRALLQIEASVGTRE
jgi:hypothetical protein